MNLIHFYKNLLIENREWIRKTSIIFLAACVVGVVVFFYRPELLGQILQVFEKKFGPDPGLNMHLVQDLFVQNLTASVIALVGGVVLGISSFLVAVTNGFILGYIVISLFRVSEQSFGNDLLFIIAGLVPHAILELPAFIIAAAFGLKLGTRYLMDSSYGNRLSILRQDLKSALIILPAIAVALFIAALIEVYVSGKLTESGL